MIRSLVKVTAWERESPARRLLCAFGRVTWLAAVLTLIGYSTFAHWYAIEAKVWHWRHGYAATIGSYEIPVPDHWVILDRDSKSFTMANTSPTPPRGDDKFHTTAVVTVHVDLSMVRRNLKNPGWMDNWLSFERRQLADQKVEAATEKTLKLREESITCIGGKELQAALKDTADVPQIEAMSLSCRSDRGLSVMFVGEPADVEAFYTLLSQIHSDPGSGLRAAKRSE
jgi:hypothetical protein